MSPELLAVVLFASGLILLFGELLLPTGGVLGILGGLLIVAGIGATFYVNQWVGLAVFIAVLVLAPMLGSWVLNAWPKTGIGRQAVLQPVQVEPPSGPAVQVGQTGVAVTELRPMGECEFGEERMEAISERGLIPPGQAVKVVGTRSGRPLVRAVQQA